MILFVITKAITYILIYIGVVILLCDKITLKHIYYILLGFIGIFLPLTDIMLAIFFIYLCYKVNSRT